MGFNCAEGFGPYTFACIEKDRDIDINRDRDRLREKKRASDRSVRSPSVDSLSPPVSFPRELPSVVAISMSLLDPSRPITLSDARTGHFPILLLHARLDLLL